MHQEITCATDFIVKMLGSALVHPHKDSFRERLSEALQQHCNEHWFPERPHHGSAYRCIRFEGERCDPVVRRAAEKAGVELAQLSLTQSFAVWIDPADVSARIGERGSIFSLQEGGDGSSNSSSSALSSSPSPLSRASSPLQIASASTSTSSSTPSPQTTSPVMSPRMPAHHAHHHGHGHHHQQQQQQMYYQPSHQQQYYASSHHQHHQYQYQQQHQQQHQHQQQQQSQAWSYNQRQPLVVYA